MTVTAADEERLAPARAAFERWAATQPAHPRNPGSLISRIETSDQYAGLLATDIQGRRVVWKAVSFAGKARVAFPSIALESIDPWTADAPQLRAQSEHIAICDTCDGSGKVECDQCSGGSVTCSACNGERKMYGYAANGSRRLLNCQSCRGKGEIDCAHCRRGIAVCGTCAGERRVQKWLELQWWRRSEMRVGPERIAQQFEWPANPSNAAIERDGAIAFDVQKPARLTPTDIAPVPPEWLMQLAPPLQPGERVVHQRLRIARIPSFTVHYEVGGDSDRMVFEGRRLIAPAHPATAFTRRALHLRSMRNLLFAIGLVLMFLALVRGMHYWSIPTLLSLVAVAMALGAVYGAASDWTAARKQWRAWSAAAAVFLAIASGFTSAALPSPEHVLRLIAEGNFDDAKRELDALGDDAPSEVFDRLTIARALEHAKANELQDAAALLVTVSSTTPRSAELAAALRSVYIPLAQHRISRTDWPGAADAIAKARDRGIAESELAGVCESIHAAADKYAAEALAVTSAKGRLRLRLAAEETFIAWETATGKWGTPQLIALRTAMARDLAQVEKRSGR